MKLYINSLYFISNQNMPNISKLLILCFLFNYPIFNCKKKQKKTKMNSYYKNYIPPADLIRPTDISRELFCDVCQALFTEALKNLRNLNKEKDVTFYLHNNICAQNNFNGYHFSNPEMEIACEVFIGVYYDPFEKILIERIPNKDTNETLIKKFCYKKIKACNGVNLTNIKPIKAEIIDGELYDIETEEKVYKVIPKIEEVNLEEFNSYDTNKFNKNGEL